MEIQKLERHETHAFRNLLEIFREVFEIEAPHPTDAHLSKLLSQPDFMAFVVRENGQELGGLTVYVLHRYFSEKPIAYIYDVGITPAHQGKGLGKALMAEVCRYCAENGMEEAYVEAEADDHDAVEFYRRTPHDHEITAIHFTYELNTVIPDAAKY